MKKTLVALSFCALLGASLAAEPSLHEVHQAAESSRLTEARGMMREVLQQHPNGAKAHYVEAELLARDGQPAQAASKQATAEKPAPGLPFAKTESVAHLRQAIGQGQHRSATASVTPARAAPAAPPPGGVAAQPAAGMGSQIHGGQAAGSREVASETLMHHFLDGKPTNHGTAQPPTQDFEPIARPPAQLPEALGGNDFGIADAGSWDDGGRSDGDWS